MHGVAGHVSCCCHAVSVSASLLQPYNSRLYSPACLNHTFAACVCRLAPIKQLQSVSTSLSTSAHFCCRRTGSTLELHQRSGSLPKGGSTPGVSTVRWRAKGMSPSTGTLPKTLPGYASFLCHLALEPCPKPCQGMRAYVSAFIGTLPKTLPGYASLCVCFHWNPAQNPARVC